MEQFDIKIQELEFKYKADDIELEKFIKFAEAEKPVKVLHVGSDDTYYSPKNNENYALYGGNAEFIRYRQGSQPQLTTKQKVNQHNNNSRIEVDVLLSKKQTKSEMDIWMESIGFAENFTVYKECYIYFYEKIDIVFYIVREPGSETGKILGSFMEVEARKDAKFTDENEAWNLVKEWEQKFSIFGITPQNRLKKSMWEMFKK